ncbi:hypothetical protein [Candidatus Bathycorpusculum sp.]|jgi:hypothetical protein|uniref:hypothetical protein n=1 Tax=Candidatus Bathycorpusculum sp. TaxID=2994959 RepID=UPI0028347543|nr:hypothetical protein [Candidatus Termitimicrobium sp.]MCL2686105.1 hypothetical protein [Candidatus Termitimicrobium sp.]
MSRQATQRKRIIGIIAVALIVIVTIFAILGYLTFIEWILADVVIAAIANILLRKFSNSST